jgi:succinate dehydrogenase hydrophobic anchor subunit
MWMWTLVWASGLPSESPSGSPSRPSSASTGGTNSEDRLRARLTAVAIIALTATVVLMAATDTLGRLFRDPAFHVSEPIVGMFLASLLALLGIKGFERFLNR